MTNLKMRKILINWLFGVILGYLIYNTQIQIDFGRYTFHIQSLNKVLEYKWNWIYIGHKRGLIKIFEKDNKKTEKELENADN